VAWSFRDVEVVATGGPPEVRLSGRAAARASELGVNPVVSLTHTDTVAGAVALLQ
jgi:holo-[acyl-carrier protein] synthase